MIKQRRESLILCALLALGVSVGCQEAQVFQDVEKRFTPIADFEDLQLQGQERLLLQAAIETDMIHPEIQVNWTNLNREIEIDLFILRAENYDPGVPPSQLDFYWSSRQSVPFAERITRIAVHTAAGQWLLLFHNTGDAGNPLHRAELSSESQIAFFR